MCKALGARLGACLVGGSRVESHHLAFDLGAESGRAILGSLSSGILNISEVYRFPNEPVQTGHSRCWDILRLWLEMKRALDTLPIPQIDSIGVDTWGVDYALIGEQGQLLENPYHYHDQRTDGIMEEVFRHVSREIIYSSTGSQFLPFNTLYQFYAACHSAPKLIDASQALLTIPDLLNYWLTGSLVSEYTNAATTQFVEADMRTWATGLLHELHLPARLLMPIVKPGTVIGKLKDDVSSRLAGTCVVAPACHDTGSAFAAVPAGGKSAFLSSGTWSLLGAELQAPVINPGARNLNFTNEGHLFKNGRTRNGENGLRGLGAVDGLPDSFRDAARRLPG
jgi:rhamnulokinase